jgi:hypothetical protein
MLTDVSITAIVRLHDPATEKKWTMPQTGRKDKNEIWLKD